MHVKEKTNFDAAQNPTDCTHSRLWTQACRLTRPSCTTMVHVDTLARSHTHHTTPQIHWWERAREAQHIHCYTPTWLAWVLSTSGPLVTNIHTTLSSWQLIITPQPAALSLMWRDCRINELASERSVTPPNYILSFAPPPPEDPINNIVVT